jgi:hypothetical protein
MIGLGGSDYSVVQMIRLGRSELNIYYSEWSDLADQNWIFNSRKDQIKQIEIECSIVGTVRLGRLELNI